MNSEDLKKHIHNFWDSEIVPTLVDYIKIPNKSPSFDPDWKKHGHMDRVLDLAANWTEKNKPVGSEMIIKKSPGRTPLLLLDIPGTKEGNILMYGHLDKQPEMEGWDDDLGPWNPVIKKKKWEYLRDIVALFVEQMALKIIIAHIKWGIDDTPI